MDVSVTRRTATNWGIVENTTTGMVVTYIAATTRRKVAYSTGMDIPTG